MSLLSRAARVDLPATIARHRPSRRLARAASIPVVTSLALALSVPVTPVAAAGATVALSPTQGTPGMTVVVTGVNFPARSRVQVLWNSQFKGYPTAWVDAYGTFKAAISVPRGTAGATHIISVRKVLDPNRTKVYWYSQLSPVIAHARFTMLPHAQPAPTAAGPYGTVLAADSKANLPVGPWGRVSHRFVASTTSRLVSVRFSQRGGSGGYSGGTGGTMRITIQTDKGGVPSGTVLASLSFSPGNPGGGWTKFNRYSFGAPPSLTRGVTYHVVYQNIDSRPTANFISVNDIFAYNAANVLRPPALTPVFATLDQEDGYWAVKREYTPAVDLTYANGVHDGQAYIEAMVAQYGSISGSSRMVRETFTVSGGSRTVSSAAVRVRRTGGTSPLVVRLETAGGKVLRSASVAASAVGVSRPGDFGYSVSETWVLARFASPVTLANGARYNLRLSTASGTEYTTIPLREGTDSGLASFRFTDGSGQRTTNGGSSWSNLYEWSPVDLQFFLQ